VATNMTFQDFITPVPADWLNNVNTVVNELESGTLPVNNLTVTGTATGTTPALYDNSTKFATTNFVNVELHSILAYGGVNDGVTDNTAALNAALASANQFLGRVVVYFPPGKYVFNSTINYSFPNGAARVMIMGAGADITELSWPTASVGLQFNYQGAFDSVYLRDLSFTCGSTNTATAIFLNQTATSIPNPALSAPNEFTNLIFRGDDGYLVNHGWNTAINVFAVSYVNFINCMWVGNLAGQGVGILLHGLNVTCQGVGANLINCNFNYLNIGIVYTQWWQGLTCYSTGFTGGSIGIQSPTNIGGTDSLICTGCAFNTSIAGIQTQSPVANMQITGSIFFSVITGTTIGMQLTQYSSFTCVGNVFQGVGGLSGQVGIGMGTLIGPSGGIITGNNFFQLGIGVDITSTATAINVQSNMYTGNLTNVVNAGSGNTVGGGSP
jgi:hypothetical protein